MTDLHDYSDIIDLPHHISTEHPQMKIGDRAAQFAPFAALTGHNDAIEETARITDGKPELSEYELEILNDKFKIISENIHKQKEITVSYFVPDIRKEGGRIETYTGIIRRIDEVEKKIIFDDGKEVFIEMITDLDTSKLLENKT